ASVQRTTSAAKTQGPGSYRSSTGRTFSPTANTKQKSGLVVEGRSFINRLEWESEDRLRVYPTLRGRTVGTLPWYRDASWREVTLLAPEADTNAMRDQFLCHLDFVPFKPSWNLDLKRPDVGYWSTAKAWCNP